MIATGVNLRVTGLLDLCAEDNDKGAVSGSSGCYNSISYTGQLKLQTIISPSSRGYKSKLMVPAQSGSQ